MMLVVEPRAAAEFGGGIVSQDSEFSHCIYGRLEDKASVYTVEVIGAVNQKSCWTPDAAR